MTLYTDDQHTYVCRCRDRQRRIDDLKDFLRKLYEETPHKWLAKEIDQLMSLNTPKDSSGGSTDNSTGT
jgi:hypothetical protein